MPRRPPGAVRAAMQRPRRSSSIEGLPDGTCRLLDRLDRLHLRSQVVRGNLESWRRLSRGPRAQLQEVFDHADPGSPGEGWLDEVRGGLLAAIGSLPRGHARHLAVLVDRLDQRVVRRTHPGADHWHNPGFDEPPHEGWWRYRAAWKPELTIGRQAQPRRSTAARNAHPHADPSA